jgi:hypothetical protein
MTNDGNNENGISTFSTPRYNTYTVVFSGPFRGEASIMCQFCRL